MTNKVKSGLKEGSGSRYGKRPGTEAVAGQGKPLRVRFANPLNSVETSGFPVKGLHGCYGGSSSGLADHPIGKPDPLHPQN
jgi:hypothetical protein